MKKLIPVILMVLGLVGGGGAGIMLRQPVEPPECAADDESCEQDMPIIDAEPETEDNTIAEGENPEGTLAGIEYVALQRQVIVPIVDADRVVSLMVLSLSLEVVAGATPMVYDRQPKLRDAFLEVLFRHANTGGFEGVFTSGEKMSDLRNALNGAAKSVLGENVVQVLVTEILRQAV